MSDKIMGLEDAVRFLMKKHVMLPVEAIINVKLGIRDGKLPLRNAEGDLLTEQDASPALDALLKKLNKEDKSVWW